jgi:hypothetical protein
LVVSVDVFYHDLGPGDAHFLKGPHLRQRRLALGAAADHVVDQVIDDVRAGDDLCAVTAAERAQLTSPSGAPSALVMISAKCGDCPAGDDQGPLGGEGKTVEADETSCRIEICRLVGYRIEAEGGANTC